MSRLIDPILLRTLTAVVRSRSFSRAAEQLSLRQSTVSQHVQRLEAQLGRRLIARDTHSVAPTPEGEAVLGFARTVLDAHERLERTLAGGAVQGRLRFGASEDFVQTRFAEALRDFRASYPSVDFELSVSFTQLLGEAVERGDLDLFLGKRRVGEAQGLLVRRDRLVWVGLPSALPERDEPVSILTFPAPSITRAIALEALARESRAWRISCTCASLSGLRAAALAGLGLMVQARSLIADGLQELAGTDLPRLPEVEFILAGPGLQREPSRTLAHDILHADIWD
ncbi:LysR substrate-binding domain-containing protein [Methylobacterium nodulans]|uniref:Transcriptional regulator, LysR family n=1 Tax=Methylobacterium nodulans (strain LMG 21967 / CNCM I-2342 / ORS 2060) TaxID=460265 RepID=B8IHA3_METNO|nr:LysR substrate-binding domain-containing protein [Methylobacterium nodulans]ACL59795.1 transcriptional regulator, LysR family [Methylobacterium nodulans ORS 2060]